VQRAEAIDGQHDSVQAVVDVVTKLKGTGSAMRLADLEPTRPREAKKVIANVLAALGRVTVNDQAIHVRLAPAANRSERKAIQHLFIAINQRALVLPSDPKRLPLRFDLQPL
jgi:hypothetical protein